MASIPRGFHTSSFCSLSITHHTPYLTTDTQRTLRFAEVCVSEVPRSLFTQWVSATAPWLKTEAPCHRSTTKYKNKWIPSSIKTFQWQQISKGGARRDPGGFIKEMCRLLLLIKFYSLFCCMYLFTDVIVGFLGAMFVFGGGRMGESPKPTLYCVGR